MRAREIEGSERERKAHREIERDKGREMEREKARHREVERERGGGGEGKDRHNYQRRQYRGKEVNNL